MNGVFNNVIVEAASSSSVLAAHQNEDRDTSVGVMNLPARTLERRSCLAPSHYIGRPAAMWIDAMRPRRSRTQARPPATRTAA